MAFNFSANQYDNAFKPTRLCNWEIPRKCAAIAPKKRENVVTKIVADDRGHLLQRTAAKNLSPWSNACRRTCLCAEKRNARKDVDSKMKGAADILSAWERRSSHVPVFGEDSVSASNYIRKGSICNGRKKTEPDDNVIEKIEHPKSPNECNNEKETEKPISNVAPQQPTTPNECENEKENEKQPSNPVPEQRTSPNECGNEKENAKQPSNLIPTTPLKTASNVEPALRNAYSNDILAKNLRMHDRKHQSLADVVENRSFAASQMKGECFPGLRLNVDADTTAVGCKVYQSPGPTQCSKLKVFRPKTATKVDDKENEHVRQRPKTTSSVQTRARPLREMDLAIYWDVCDGGREISSAKSFAAPTPAAAEQKMDGETHRSRSVSSTSSRDAKHPEAGQEIGMQKASEEGRNAGDGSFPDPVSDEKTGIQPPVVDCTALVPVNLPAGGKAERTSSNSMKRESEWREPPQSSCNKCSSKRSQESVAEAKKSSTTAQKIRNEKYYRSAPDLRQLTTSRVPKTAVKCRRIEIPEGTNKVRGSGYKMAFKAGKLNNFNANDQLLERIEKSRNLRIPKPRMPFAKKSYAIRTLVPPFSIWPQVTGYDYPDHWRLVSIYQHSYKPLEARKTPLMKTVFQ